MEGHAGVDATGTRRIASAGDGKVDTVWPAFPELLLQVGRVRHSNRITSVQVTENRMKEARSLPEQGNGCGIVGWCSHFAWYRQRLRISLADDFDEDPLASPTIELTVEYLLPRPEVQLALRDGDNDLSTHNLPFQMGIAVVFPGSIVPILTDGLVGGKPLQPLLVVLVKTAFIVVDEHRCRNVLGIYEDQTFLDPALAQALLHFGRDVDECPAAGYVEYKFVPVAFHFPGPPLNVVSVATRTVS